MHCTDERHIRPVQIAIANRSTLMSTSRLFQCFGRSAATVISPNGGCAARLPHETKRMFEAPVGFWKLRVYQQGVHRPPLHEEGLPIE